MSSWLQAREQGSSQARNLLDNFSGLGTQLAIFVEFVVERVQTQHVPSFLAQILLGPRDQIMLL